MSLLATVLLLWDSLPTLWLSADPVPWITPGLSTFLWCQRRVQGVAFLLRREGDDGFLEVAESDGFLERAGLDGSLDINQGGYKEQAVFLVHQPGNYSCSYQTRRECASSKPSGIVTIREYATPPPPMLTILESSTTEPPQMAQMALFCVAPLNDVEFQLRQGSREMKIPMVSASPEQFSFYLKLSDMGDQSPFTCRYRLSRMMAWSEDSEPLELMWSDETLPAPVFTAEPSSKQSFEPGSMVQLRCTAPSAGLHSEAGLRFSLHLQDSYEHRLIQTLKSSSNETVFQLQNLSAIDSASYSCISTELALPFSGSIRVTLVTLMVKGPPSPPKLQALWTGKVSTGHDAVLRCQSDVPWDNIVLLRDGNLVPFRVLRVLRTYSDLVLHFVGPQHTGSYTCCYTSWWPKPLYSKPSNPVELLVEGN